MRRAISQFIGRVLVFVASIIHKLVVKFGVADTNSSCGYKIGVIRSIYLDYNSYDTSIEIGQFSIGFDVYSPEYTVEGKYEWYGTFFNPYAKADWDNEYVDSKEAYRLQNMNSRDLGD